MTDRKKVIIKYKKLLKKIKLFSFTKINTKNQNDKRKIIVDKKKI